MLVTVLLVALCTATAQRGVATQPNRRLLFGSFYTRASPSPPPAKNFNRISTFLVCSQLEPNCDVDTETVAETIDVAGDGMKLVYSDSELSAIGFVDVRHAQPTAMPLDGARARACSATPARPNCRGDVLTLAHR